MPPRGTLLNTDAVKQLFQKYGYTITEPAFQYHNQTQKIHVRNDLTYSSEYWSVKQLKYRIDKGKLVEVDPFLHTVLYGDINEVYQDHGRNPPHVPPPQRRGGNNHRPRHSGEKR